METWSVIRFTDDNVLQVKLMTSLVPKEDEERCGSSLQVGELCTTECDDKNLYEAQVIHISDEKSKCMKFLQKESEGNTKERKKKGQTAKKNTKKRKADDTGSTNIKPGCKSNTDKTPDDASSIKKQKHASQSGGHAKGGGGGKRKPNFSSMKQPPLIEMLKGILSEYPDGGQIIKELIQNAEDAGASSVKIMYDARDVNQESSNDDKYSKFFKGPALLLYNDGLFTSEDWDGIKMIYSSVKKKDRLKVGRFGLGFKSVFHITDFPSVLSGNKLLLINPQEHAGEVNAEFEVDELGDYEGIDESEFLTAFEGQFQNTDTLTSESFQGTVFRFPFRQVETNLSETIYTEQKILSLFEAFKKEAASILLFLKSIASITLNTRKGEQDFEDIANVELIDNVEDVKKERRRFKEAISGFSPDYIGDPAESFSQVRIQTTLFSQNQQTQQSLETWLVVNYFMGNNASDNFKKLIQDKSIGYCPYVGVAAPLFQDTDGRLEGHTFCFLPLPLEGSKQTGLPFHVNGFFALNQSRHHIKWPTDEQKDSQITDKNVLWNQCIIKEAVPLAYRVLVENAIEIGKTDNIGPEVVTQILPLHNGTAENWRPFLKNMFEQIRDLDLLKVDGSNKWMRVSKACFATLSHEDQTMKSQLIRALLVLKQPYVNVSLDVFNTFDHFYGGIADLGPPELANLLKGDRQNTYKSLPHETKLCLLRFLMSTSDYNLVDGLELIPLVSGRWNTFIQRWRTTESLLLSSESFKELTFPGLEHTFIDIPDVLLPHFNKLCEKEMYTVKHQTYDDTVQLLDTILSSMGGRLEQGSVLSLDWLEKVWRHFRGCIDKISNLTLVPVLCQGSWQNPVIVDLIKLNKAAIFKVLAGHEPLSDGLCHCLEQLSVTVLPSYPEWFPVTETSVYISQPSQHSVYTLLVKLVQKHTDNLQTLADRLNMCFCEPLPRQEFCNFVTNCHINDRSLIIFLRKLNIFLETEGGQSERRFVSLDSPSHQLQFLKDFQYPIRYPKPYLISDGNNEQLLLKLGAKMYQRTYLIEMTLQQMTNPGIMSRNYNEQDRITFMKFLIGNLYEFESNLNIMSRARQVKFLKCGQKMPSELFDPTEKVLRNIFNDDKFPNEDEIVSSDGLHILKKLGLRDFSHIGTDHILEVASDLDMASKQRIPCEPKASAILEVLKSKPALLEKRCSTGNLLKIELTNLQWVQVVEDQPTSFPSCMPWYKHSYSLCQPAEAKKYDLWHVVGSTMPTVRCDSDTITRCFGWDKDPPVPKVVEQLRVTREHYNIRCNSEILLMFKNIFQFLNKHRNETKQVLNSRELLWCGHKFVSPCSLIVHKSSGNLDLQPYLFFMPEEFVDEFSALFIDLGCNARQDVNVLIYCLQRIKDKHQRQHTQNVEEDLKLVVRILEKLEKEDKTVLAEKLSEIFIPVKTTSCDVIVFKAPSECTYTDHEDMYDEEDEGEYNFVHECITEQMARSLGIRTLRRHILDEAEGLEVEEWGQEEPLTTRLNSLLREGYKDGLSVPKELVQNADDACAKTVKILYDERQNKENTSRLLNKGMVECHGPALWFYNDASFTEQDFANIIKLNGATKKNDTAKIGKFGLGFCSVYNLTDVPCFYSRQTFVFLDPHRKYLGDTLPGQSPGIRINLTGQRRNAVLRKYRDQFQPFQDVFDCHVFDKDVSFDGTLFRFPLRTENQASISKIKQMAYTKEEVAKLLSMFIETAGDLFLFTQNIETIELYYLGPEGKPNTDITLVCSMVKNEELVDAMGYHRHEVEGILKKVEMSILPAVSEVHITNININIFGAAKCIIENTKDININCTWLISWSTGTNEAKALAKMSNERRALPVAAVAVPCTGLDNYQPYQLDQLPFGFHKSGRLFCFLPLPLESGLNMHVNAYFDVTSDRRQLLSDSEDDKKTQTHQWNKALLTDATVGAFMQLLETVANASSMIEYYKLWPTNKPNHTKAFVTAFYKAIVSSDSRVFKSEGNGTLSFDNVVFIDPKLREDKDIGHLCFKVLKQFPPISGKQVIDIPPTVFRIFRDSNNESNLKSSQKAKKKKSKKSNCVEDSTILPEDLILTFLDSLQHSFWQDNMKMRNTFIAFSLKSNSVKVKDKMKSTNCIPTKPNERLRTPSEIVKNVSWSVAPMFSEEDERFVINDPMFSCDVINKIEELGMITDRLPANLLIERCSHIAQKGQSCCICAYELSLKILHYLCRPEIANDIKADEHTFSAVCNEYIMPVLNRPQKWNLPWYSEECEQIKTFSQVCQLEHHPTSRQTLSIAQPTTLHRQVLENQVGCVALIVDEYDYKPTYGNYDALQYLGVQSVVSFQIALRQLQILASSYTRTDAETEYTFKTCIREIYSTLWLAFRNAEAPEQADMIEQLKTLSDSPVILIDRDLIKPCNVAFNLKFDCHPYMHQLPGSELSRRSLFQALGVKEYFTHEYVIDALVQETDKWLGQPCNDVDTNVKLLQNLEDSMTREGLLFKDLTNHSKIVAPDQDQVLRPTSDLVVDDEEFTSKQTVHVLNDNIPRALAEKLGVKSKQKKCRANISRGIPFGQKEELVTRLNGLLKAYPCDSGIMKELIQNADDAGATEVYFITDFSTHEEDPMYGCKMINEPSLCVYNNSVFSEQDLKGIHDLGRGSKGDDPTKTGQYGVGFNAVYHLTDLPSFMTVGPGLSDGGAMCIFDPLCKHIEDVQKYEPGIRSDVNGLKSDFPKVLLGFHEAKLLSNGIGTVFRFPLRQTESCISSKVINQESMTELLNELKADMFEALLFVRNITCIKILNISAGSIQEEYMVRLQMPEEDSHNLKSFHTKLKENVTKNKDEKLKNLQGTPLEVQYKVKVEDSANRNKSWLIVQRFGVGESFQDEKHAKLLDAFNRGSIGLLPIGGIAIQIDRFEEISEWQTPRSRTGSTRPIDNPVIENRFSQLTRHVIGRAFCFLPLPIQTGLPVHINAHFALDHEARRDLWKEGYREQWNDFILKHVVIPAWISGITTVQTLYVDRYIVQLRSWKQVNDLFSLFHSIFPTYRESTQSTYWERSVRFFYDHTTKSEKALYPVVNKRSTFSVSWHPTTSSGGHFSGVFNKVISVLQKKTKLEFGRTQKLGYLLSDIFKELGMKLLHPTAEINSIRKTLETFEFPTRVSDTCTIIDFLKTFDKEGDCCRLGGINIAIEDTHFRNCGNLRDVVYYLHLDNDFKSKVDGLPLMLTADGILRVCSANEPVIASWYLDLVPQSANLFLHKQLLTFFQPPDEKKLSETETEVKTVVVNLTTDKFLELLPNSCDASVYRAGKPVPWVEGSLVTIPWINKLFHFLFIQNPDKFQETLERVREWSFLPYVDMHMCRSLIPIDMFYTLYKDKTSDENVNKVLKCLPLPRLDEAVFKEMKAMRYGILLRGKLYSYCASTYNPSRMLQCLLHHKMKLRSDVVTTERANVLLSYFSRNIQVLKEEYESSLKGDLRQLPLFTTIQQTVVSIDGSHRVLVLPSKIPRDGIEVWANSEAIILLQSSDLFQPLYQYLQLTMQDSETFYTNILLPKITQSMPAVYWKAHILYIRKSCYYACEPEMQAKIKRLVKEVPFIQSKRAKDYYYHDEPVFQCMLPNNNFLPEEYRLYEWISFLEELGLIVDVDDEHFVRFAREIEIRSHTMNDDIVKKAFFLVNNLTIRKKSASLLQQIRNIRFLVPFKVENSLKNYCPQYENAARLICFANSVSEKRKRLCWTSMPLLQESIVAVLNKEDKARLGVISDPPVDKVIEHCSELCMTFKQRLDNDKDCPRLANFVEEQMFFFYDHLNRHTQESSLHQGLNHVPFMYIPEVRDMVLPDRTVIELQHEDQIIPYLYKVPREYGKYISLFTKLGSLERLTCQKLASILDEVHSKHQDKEVIGGDFGVVSKALWFFFHILLSKGSAEHMKESLCQVNQLYLPNKKKVLCQSNTIYINNAPSFERRLKEKLFLNWFIGFRDLKIDISDDVAVFQHFPENIRPKFLKDRVTEHICIENMKAVKCRETAERIETFLQSTELLEGLIRLEKHYSQQAFKVEIVHEIQSKLKSVRCVEVVGLQTFLKLDTIRVDDFESKKRCHIGYDGNQSTFYFQVNEHKRVCDLVKERDGLFWLVRKILSRKVEAFYILGLLDCIDKPDVIRHFLDDWNIDPYRICSGPQVGAFPRPGTYVEDKMLPFLVHDLRPFEPHEYRHVAMEFRQEDGDGSIETTYKYVHILRRDTGEGGWSPLSLLYTVDCGDDIDRDVQIWCLYRFVRPPGEEIDNFGNTPKNETEFEQCCHQVRNQLIEAWEMEIPKRNRIIKRLLRHWCDGSNKGNVYARREFNYISEVVIQLEHGDDVSRIITKETGLIVTDTSDSFVNSICQSVQRESRHYVESYRSSSSGYRSYSHRSAQEVVRPDVKEAKRWLKQATNDYQAACAAFENMTDVQGHNWTCYKCHQSSEKAMKAVLYSINANKVPNNVESHKLTSITSGLSAGMKTEARLLMTRLGDQSQLRYPDVVQRDRIPSDMYGEDDSKFAIEHTKRVIELANEAIQ